VPHGGRPRQQKGVLNELEEIAELNESSERESEMIISRKVDPRQHLNGSLEGNLYPSSRAPHAPRASLAPHAGHTPRVDLESNKHGPGTLDHLYDHSLSHQAIAEV